MRGAALATGSIDRSFRAMLKLHVYDKVLDVLARSLGGMNGSALRDAKPTLGRFTARKADFLFVPRKGNALSSSADFYGFTSHKVREKLRGLEREGVVGFEGRGLRDAYTYRWMAPLRLHELCSFIVLWKALRDDLSLGIELARVFEAAGTGPFTFQGFAHAYGDAHRREYNGSRWGARRYERLRSSSDYERFLKARLQKLVARGLVTEVPGGYRLAERARELVDHFNLFTDGAPYRASRAMCLACPLFQACRVRGEVEPSLASLSDHLVAAANGASAARSAPEGAEQALSPGSR